MTQERGVAGEEESIVLRIDFCGGNTIAVY